MTREASSGMAPGLDRRSFLKGLAAAGVAALPGGCGGGGRPAAAPNVLIVQPDQHRGPTLGCAGDRQAYTPHIDRMAAEGVRFSHAVSTSPSCIPFRASMQTGRPWFATGNPREGFPLSGEYRTFAEVAGAHGYATGYVGKWHLDGSAPDGPGGFVPVERRQGWEDWLGYDRYHEYFDVWTFDEAGERVPVEGYDWEPTWQTDQALAFIGRHTAERRPWMYYVSYGPPHHPPQCPAAYLERFPPGDFELPPDLAGRLEAAHEVALREAWQMYYAQITAVDHEVGRLLAGLADLGIDRDTLVLFCSDHGDRLGSHGYEILRDGRFRIRGKTSPHANAFRIPLILRWPGTIPAGGATEALVGSEDLGPTLLDLIGLPTPDGMLGRSVAGWAREGRGAERDAILLGIGVGLGRSGWRALWDGRVVFSTGKHRVLYDHVEDPYEMVNRYETTDTRELRDRLVALAREAGDPAAGALERG